MRSVKYRLNTLVSAFILLTCVPGQAEESAAFKGDREGHTMVDVIPKEDIPAAPILPVAKALQTFQAQSGFVVESVVSEPDIFNPVALSFDAKGRMWVAEMTTYMPDVFGEGEMQAQGNITLLEDTDGDGQVDKRRVFVSGVLLPRTVSMVKGGIFYADHTQLYFVEVLEDEQGIRLGLHEVVDAEYAAGGSLEHKTNTMLYGIDNWYYNARSDKKYQTLPLTAAVPQGAEEIYRNQYWKLVKAETDYRGQWGLSMDDLGRLYHNGNSSPIHGEFLRPGALRRNPGFWPDAPAHAIGSNRVYPSRMNPGVNRGYMDGILVKEGADRGKLVNFTAASGSIVYRGSNFPSEYYGIGITPEPAGNLLSARFIKEGDGELTGEAVFPGQELLTSTDERFRPVNLYNAPDGTLYIVDMYHGILQHREFLTSYLADQIKSRDLDKNNNTMGRVYRLRWQQHEAAKVPDMSALSASDLVAFLSHKNAWQRDTARRLLIENEASLDNKTAVVSAIKKSLEATEDSKSIINLLWALRGLHAVDLATVSRFINHDDNWVAITAATVGEALPASMQEQYRALLMRMAQHSYPRALQAAISVASIPGGHNISLYVLDEYREKPYIRDAVISGLGSEADSFKSSLPKNFSDHKTLYLLNNLGKRVQDETNRAQLSSQGRKLFDQGKALYNGRAACAGCHGEYGNGNTGLAPTLWRSEWVESEQRLAKVLLHGLSGPIAVAGRRWETPTVMPGFAARTDINDSDLSAIATYIRNSWGNQFGEADGMTADVFAELRQKTQSRRIPYTENDFSE
ncbi:c-type cytochrome [Gilvimarinus sp. SDUM040013]|uniref:PVC-type heme-binding CxxCH protein n=1 Tax=Gilvimarinus gilvus TaxID=3058038 RepID=A0ABU4S2P0_9GAMM|nr:PVC-type heme-binding CxxCH protein [Gilvimarinus sp. SDUM040013]MDO3384393.1 c-type cytochrome [Gilvimarinus sp. SDUM040013]MDX6851444.1 PVC-type heme-binding CxxCH protein [Gilvimarinus sp. SDUM040013]